MAPTSGGTRQRFHGQIAGFGTSSGTRIVIGRWTQTPLGPFADAMIERADGHRLLLAPSPQVAELVSTTYTFDEVRVEPITARVQGATWWIESRSLAATIVTGRRTALGHLLSPLPAPLAASPAWARAISPVAARVLRGVRTVGTARAGRIEYYGAGDQHAIISSSAVLDGQDLGTLTPVDPPCHFGFSSTPKAPGVTSLVTTIVSTRPARP